MSSSPPRGKGELGTDRSALPWQTRTFADPRFEQKGLWFYKYAAAASAVAGALWY
jgi:hypothetical protein